MKIRPEQLEPAIRELLESYSEEVGEQVDLAVIDVAKKALKRLKQASPARTGTYRKGWAMKQTKERNRIKIKFYNKTRYMLTHLLEHGHEKAWGGRVEAKPHIKPVEDQAEKEVISEITRRLRG